jgi:hypothetical protein
LKTFNPDDLKYFEAEAKVGLLATVNPEGLPHITLITTLQAKDPATVIWGQFSAGTSKANVTTNPKTGFMIMTPDKFIWRGKAIWKKAEKEGEDYVMFNKKPMFRYNAYLGIHTVHYMDMVDTTGKQKLPLASIICATLLTRIAGGGAEGAGEKALKPWAHNMLNRLDALKFLAYVGGDGFPVIIPVIQCVSPDSRRLDFSNAAFGDELNALKDGMQVAVFGLSMQMEDVLMRGTFRGFARRRMVSIGTVDINWVYNSMPPKPGQIYPVPELKPVTRFE